MTYDIFISYSRKDTAVADRICKALDSVGIKYFIDRQGIAGGMEFPLVLARAIVDSTLFLYLASRNSYDSKFTNSEITFAFNEKPKQSILPYIIDGSNLPLEMRFIFSGINWRTLHDHPVETVLVDDLLKLLGRERPTVIKPFAISSAPDTEAVKPVKPKPASAPEPSPMPENVDRPAFPAHEIYKLGERFYYENNYNEAFEYYCKAAKQGNPVAQKSLEICYRNGWGCRKNSAMAKKWGCEAAKFFLEYARQGNVEAMVRIAGHYATGCYVEKDYAEALKWYLKAAEQGSAEAMHELGLCYQSGNIVEKSFEEALKWYLKGAEEGYAPAQHKVGKFYEFGYGVKENMQEAIKWFRKAAEQGFEMASKDLQRLLKK